MPILETKKSKTPTTHAARRNYGSYADSSATRCHATISLILHAASGDIYLNRKSNLQYCNHSRECPDNTNCNEGDLDSDYLNLLKVLYEKGVASSSLAEIFNQMRHDRDQKGEFLPKTINNIAKKYEDIMELANGIDKNWSTTHNTLHKLNELGVSHVALVIGKDGDFLIYKDKGRPTGAEVHSTEMTGGLRNELKKLKSEMSPKDGTEILLSLSVASDEMMRAVHMFPEVGYMDVTSNTNKEGRDLHLLVVKDANGETYIGCASVLPCQQRWVFKIYICLPTNTVW